MKKSTIITEKLESLFNKTLVSRNETHWNSQIKMVRQVLQVEVNDIRSQEERASADFSRQDSLTRIC